MKNTFKVCIVGCGVISANHIPSLLRLDNVEIVALCDVLQEKANARKEEFALKCRIYTSYDEMLESEKPDAVHILTPHYLHTEMTLKALKKNINVFLEKPMCIKSEDVEKLISAEQNSQAKVCVSFQTRYNETHVKALEIANADGGALCGFGTLVWNRSDSYYESGDWRGKWATEGGGALINQAIHTIDLLCIFLRKPEKVQANISKMRHSDEVEVEDSATVIIDFENGKRANLLVTTTSHGHDVTTLHIETKNKLIDIRGENLYVDGERVSTAKPGTYMGKACYGNSHAILIEKFYSTILSGSEMPISLRSAADAMNVVLAAYKSSSKIIKI